VDVSTESGATISGSDQCCSSGSHSFSKRLWASCCRLTMCVTSPVLTKVGVKQNLVQERNHTQSLIWTAWTVDVIRGLLISGVVFFLATFAAVFFRQSQATAIVRALGLIPLLQSIQNIRIVYFQREL